MLAYIIGWAAGYYKATKANELFRDWFTNKYEDDEYN